MYLKQLKFSTFRNLSSASLEFSQQFNWIFGKNGSGKTSLLETIYLLSTGRSFRSTHAHEYIQEGQMACVANGAILSNNGGILARLGVERHKTQGLRLRMNEQPFHTLSEWVKFLPLQLINIDSYQLLNESPKQRRQFLDWAMFHVEPGYYSYLQRFRRLLKQRNAALKAKDRRNSENIESWNPEFVEVAQVITSARNAFLSAFFPQCIQYLQDFLPESLENWMELKLEFKEGWNPNHSLLTALSACLERDMALGYTSVGPHRADFGFLLRDFPVEARLSRGQIKLFISALYLARSAFVAAATGRTPLCLLDDLCSELDNDAATRLLKGLLLQKAQIFTTSINKDIILDQLELCKGLDYRMFHVEQGNIQQKSDIL